ncbi:general transcription factor IIF subunit 2 [Trichonephila clavipes]|nr:general transcription factor IIF subunit 2 [Trichonephila clavipes]
MDSEGGSSHKRQKTAERDLDCSNASRGVWLVKVPKYISSLWEKSQPLSEAGRLKIMRNGGKTDITFSLSDEMLKNTDGSVKTDLPKEHRFVISNIAHQTLAVFGYENEENGKLVLGGHVLQKGECRPLADKRYMDLKRDMILKASQPERQVKQLSKAVTSFKPISDHKHNGSVLSPALFLLYLSGIKSVIKRKCEVGAFADDIVLWKSDSDLMKLERDINLVLDFTLDHKLTFNHTKSVVSFFTTNRKLYNYQPNIFLYNQPLTINKHPKYLGFLLNPEILGSKHIVFKARKWLNILRYISGCDWGADAGTLRNMYISLIRPILEYGVPAYCSASITNLQKLEKVQLWAARIITGLKNTCPRDILTSKIGVITRDSGETVPSAKWSLNLTIGAAEPHHLSQCLDPVDDLDGVFFHPELPVHMNKQPVLPAFLKQLALERIGDIPIDAVQVYTDGSRDDYYRSGNGIYIKSQDHILRIQRRNPDGCLVFAVS